MARIITIETMDQAYRCVCSNGLHSWNADEPELNEGGDTAPSPTELLLSAVGACAVNTLRMYAKRKQLTLEKIKISLRLESIKSETSVSYQIHEVVELTGPLDEDQKNKMLSLLPKCPVARIVTGQVQIVY